MAFSAVIIKIAALRKGARENLCLPGAVGVAPPEAATVQISIGCGKTVIRLPLSHCASGHVAIARDFAHKYEGARLVAHGK